MEEKEQLRKYLLEEGRYGITDDDNFELCYRDIRKDVDELIKEGWVRVVDNYEGHKKVESNKQRIFFPRDISAEKKNTAEQAEWDEEELPQNCMEYLAAEWKKISDKEAMHWEQILASKPDLLCD